MFRRSESLAPNDGNPFGLTKQEMAMLDPNYKKPRRKKFLNQAKDEVESKPKVDPTRLHEAKTVSSYRKQRVSEDVDELWNDIESSDDYEDGSISDDDLCDPTYELIALKRSNEEKQTLKELVENSKRKFRTKYSLMVKQNETKRLERVLRNEEEQLQKAEAEFRLAQQAFDQFLQANDSKAIQAQKRAETETQVRLEKVADIKGIDEHLVALKREINKKKDVLVEYGTFETFLFSLSPEAWRMVQSDKTYQNKSGSISLQDSYPLLPKDSPDSSIANNDVPIDSLLEITAQELGIPIAELAKVKDNVKLYFKEPQQLLSLFADLEVENLDLIDQCQQAEDKLVEVKKNTKEVIDRLNEQAANFENGIMVLEQKIQNESQILIELESSMTDDESQSVDHVNLFHDKQRMVKFASSTLEGHSRRSKDRKGQELSPEDEMLINEVVSQIHDECVGESRSVLTTLDKLKRIELRMEHLTTELEKLPQNKVKIAQKTCERERRQREEEARQEEHKRQHAERNKRALDRALAPPYIRPDLRKFQPRQRVIRRRKPHVPKQESDEADQEDSEDDWFV